MDICAKLRGMYREKRIGHAGTLDPMATGVLPVFIGRATRAVEFADKGDKEYVAGLKLGIVTNTQDTSGEVLESHPVNVTPEQLEEALTKFRGDIEQIPPMYSAIKVNGKKLYELARKGKEVERKPRPVTIHALTLEEQIAPDEFVIRVRCSKGTYVRTLCHDIGQALGCGGCMEALRRVQAGEYTIAEAVPLQTLLDCEDPGQYLRGVDTMFRNYEAVKLTANQEKRCRCGNAFTLPGQDGTYRAYSKTGEFLMLAKREDGIMSTIKSFFEI
jgi:tRNA pseudouridine55 synthase